jgi:hypothetical protein
MRKHLISLERSVVASGRQAFLAIERFLILHHLIRDFDNFDKELMAAAARAQQAQDNGNGWKAVGRGLESYLNEYFSRVLKAQRAHDQS